MGTSNCLVTNFLQNILFYVPQKKGIHTGLEQHEGESIMFFWGWTIPRNVSNSVICWRCSPVTCGQIFVLHFPHNPKAQSGKTTHGHSPLVLQARRPLLSLCLQESQRYEAMTTDVFLFVFLFIDCIKLIQWNIVNDAYTDTYRCGCNEANFKAVTNAILYIQITY